MKKLIFAILTLSLLILPAAAQDTEASKVAEDVPASELTPHERGFYMGGAASCWYQQSEGFRFSLLPELGYHINQRFAVGAYLGVTGEFYDNTPYKISGVVRPYGRVCVWHNDIAFFDLEARITGMFNRQNGLGYADFGILPAVRLRVAPNVDISAHLGFLGAQYRANEGWGGGFDLSADAMSIGLTYIFY